MPPKKKKFHETIKDQEHFRKVVSGENGLLTVIDCHLEWCGPCKVIEPNYQNIWFSIDNPESRLAFWQASEETIPEEYKSRVKLSVIPSFMIWAGGEIKKVVEGAKYVDLNQAVLENIPEGPDE